jgi:single-stranded-DNA-specific exonuclease
MKKWTIHPEKAEAASRLCREANIPPLLARALINRGITNSEEAQKFLNPKLSYLRDPFEIPNIEKAARRALLAKERGEKVLVYGDYDVDGVTGTAILVHTLKLLGMDPSYYIPHRYGEGYGLSLESVKKIAETGVKLIITVDCGIASVVEIEAANALGMEVIVTDHHNLPHRLPPAVVIVNPKQIREEHPSKYLSGAGVAFKFAWALLRTAGIKDSAFLTSLLDLASLGTVSDVVPLTGENRILAVGGINLLNERKRLGIKHLAEAASLSGKISVNQIYFALAPRLNAAGRLEHASKSVELLLSDDPVRTRELAGDLNRINARRQDLGSKIKEEVFAKIDAAHTAENKIILADGEGWHPGVIGIVASQVVDSYCRPAVLIGHHDGVGRGSARSVDGVNVYELLDSCRDLFTDFGGHEGAAGFEIVTDNIPELRRRLAAEAERRIDPADLVGRIEIDAEIEPSRITLGMINELDRLQPYGEGNAPPLFMIRDLELADFKTVGSEGRHLKAYFSRNGMRLEAIGFRMGAEAKKLDHQKSYDIAFRLECNEYNGFESVQLSLVDLREAKP